MDEASAILNQLAEQSKPGVKELTPLPRWALVTLATRSARRVQPLFHQDWPNAPKEFGEAVETSLSRAETSAAQATLHPELAEAVERAGEAATHAGSMTARFASFTVTFAAINACNVAGADGRANAVAFVLSTVDACHKAATFAGARLSAFRAGGTLGLTRALTRAFRHDVGELGRMAREEEWTEATPVPVGVLGELWPEGAPAGI